MPWPTDLTWAPVNCIICNIVGRGICALAGGNNDGDTVFAVANKALIAFLERTEKVEQRYQTVGT